MLPMPPVDIKAIALRLNNAQPPRVWSLLVTTFGELGQEGNTRIGGHTLRVLMDVIGIRAEATRVALHRLRNEGWIDSVKTGRRSDYFLTPLGLKESKAASPIIYATTPAARRAYLVLAQPGSETSPGVTVSPGCVVSDRPAAGALALELTHAERLPNWFSMSLCEADLILQTQVLNETLSQLMAKPSAIESLSLAQTTALRILLVHAWRRIILKAPRLPDHVFPEIWKGADCREALGLLLNQLPKPEQLDEIE